MLSASRCSLLSRSLPLYQETALEFFENGSQELQALLHNLKPCHHHHQYRIKSEEDETCEELMASLTTADGSDSEDNVANNQPLLDLDDQNVLTMAQDSFNLTPCNYGDSPYQAIDDFSQLKTEQMDSELTSKQTTLDCLALSTDDDNDSVLSSKSQTEATGDLHLLKLDPSVPLISLMPIDNRTLPPSTATTTTTPSCVAPSLPIPRDHISSSTNPRNNWDELFGDLDPLSNEKV